MFCDFLDQILLYELRTSLTCFIHVIISFSLPLKKKRWNKQTVITRFCMPQKNSYPGKGRMCNICKIPWMGFFFAQQFWWLMVSGAVGEGLPIRPCRVRSERGDWIHRGSGYRHGGHKEVRQLPNIKVKSEVTRSCPTLCNPMDWSPPGSSVHGMFQARILEWVAISFSILMWSSSIES